MLDLSLNLKRTWEPPEIDEARLLDIYYSENIGEWDGQEKLVIIRTTPYVDSILVRYSNGYVQENRFVFYDGYKWDYEQEMLFEDCMENKSLQVSHEKLDEIFRFYNDNYPDWKLQRYYSKPLKLLDHIYSCMTRRSTKEILYKAGLDELAANIEMLDEVNLLAGTPTEIYDGLSIKLLRKLNCRAGARMISVGKRREFVKAVYQKFPEAFREVLNDAQCRYLTYLMDGDLTVGEAGRLYKARAVNLGMMWAPYQYKNFIWGERLKEGVLRDAKMISEIDPIYREYIAELDLTNNKDIEGSVNPLRYYLISQREQHDRLIRRSNRKRDPQWQERDNGYVVRYPQTINDFCREALYMHNCLLTYVDAFLNNDTTILFMRKSDDFNTPYITIEIYNNELMQAYHRFNLDCTYEEADWIENYCERHGIKHGKFSFDRDVDELY